APSARPAAAPLIRIKRRREIARTTVSSLIERSAPWRAFRSRPGLLSVRAQHVLARHLRERDDAPAFLGDELLRRGALREWDCLVAPHSSPRAAADDEQRFSRLEPVVRTRLLPARRLAHVGHVDRLNILWLIRQHGEGNGVPRRGEPDRLDQTGHEDLPLRSR